MSLPAKATEPLKSPQDYTEAELVELIKCWSHHYYNEESPLVDDATFDTFYNHLMDAYPNQALLETVGSEVGSLGEKKKVQHAFYTGSLNKLYPDTTKLNQYLKDHAESNLTLSEKLDGVSIVLQHHGTPDPQTPDVVTYHWKAITRGNGIVGFDATHLIVGTLDLPDPNDPVIRKMAPCIRGELILPKTVVTDKPRRNVISGAINCKVPRTQIMKLAHFVAYEIQNLTIQDDWKCQSQLNTLKQMGFRTPLCETHTHIQETTLIQCLDDFKERSAYDIDGIVLVPDVWEDMVWGKNPKQSVAFKKPPLSGHLTQVRAVHWNVSKDGYLRPRVEVDPVNIDGCQIRFATAFHAKYVRDHCLGPGSRISIIRSGEVIPYIFKVHSYCDSPSLPDMDCAWSESGVDLIVKDATLQVSSQLEHFIRMLDVKFINAATIRDMIDKNYTDIEKIVGMKPADFLKLDRCKSDKNATKIWTSLQSSMERATCMDLMASTNLFGRGVSKGRLEQLVQECDPACPEQSRNLMRFLRGELPESMKRFKIYDQIKEGIQVFGVFLDHSPHFKTFFDQALQRMKNLEEKGPSSSSSSSTSGYRYVFSGFRHKALEAYLHTRGHKVQANVDKSTHGLIVKNLNGSKTRKILQAEKYGCPVHELSAFMQDLGVPDLQ